MEHWLNFIISIASGIISGLIIYLAPILIKKEKKVSFTRRDKKSILVVLTVVVIVSGIVWLVLSFNHPPSDAADHVSSGSAASMWETSTQSSASAQSEAGSSEKPVTESTVLQLAGAAQTQSHKAGPGHNTSATVVVKSIEFAEDFSIVTVEAENNGDTDLEVSTVALHGSTALIVNGASYAYIKHKSDTIVAGTTETITYYFARCDYSAGGSIALNMHLGLPLQYNIKELQKNAK